MAKPGNRHRHRHQPKMLFLCITSNHHYLLHSSICLMLAATKSTPKPAITIFWVQCKASIVGKKSNKLSCVTWILHKADQHHGWAHSRFWCTDVDRWGSVCVTAPYKWWVAFFSFVLGHALSQHLFVSKFYKFDTNHRLPLLEELISIYRRWFILKEGDEVSMDVKRYLIDKCLEF